MIDKYLEAELKKDKEGYYLRSYGGRVDFPEPQVSDNGLLTINFSRPVVFKAELLAEFNSEYVYSVPNYKLS